MRISYLVTTHNETKTLKNLLDTLEKHLRGTEDELVILDDFSTNPETQQIIDGVMNRMRYDKDGNPLNGVFQHALNKDYGTHKNYGNSKCKCPWIFQIDGDELPHENLLLNVKGAIEANPNIELFWLPRVNDFIGVTPDDAQRWGWRLTPCLEYNNRPIVSWPDWQGRIYKNDPDRIKWIQRLHERIDGYKETIGFPAEVKWSLYHDKDIVTQNKTNERYMTTFTDKENAGGTHHK